jgi:hypothetical protein
MKSIELNYDEDIVCPFCNKTLTDYEDIDFEICTHTVFVASDYGFEYVREDYQNIVNNDADLLNIDAYTKSLPFNGIRLVQYAPNPGSLGSYWGFVEE